MLDEGTKLLVDADCESLQSVQMVVTTAHKLLPFAAPGNLKKTERRLSTAKGRTSFSIASMPTEIANMSYA